MNNCFAKKAMLLVTALVVCIGLSAQAAPGGIEVGFIGRPLLAKNGYKAASGVLNIGVAGQGAVQNLENLTDNDPENYASTVNLANATVALDHLVKILPDADAASEPAMIPQGTEVGFVVAADGAGVNVLNVEVLKFFAIYFYDKDGNYIEGSVTQGRSGGETSLIGLDVINVNQHPGKIVCNAPVDCYGIGFGLAGVDAKVLASLRIYYGFVDDFATVPIIQKYYPGATAQIAGMTAGSKNLINNNLSDGAAMGVLNIGGGYYKVMANEEIPAGVEIGFVINSASLLNLPLGEAFRLSTLDASGNKIQTATNVNVIGLQVASGGGTKISMMTTGPCYGAYLECIKVLEVDLGATLINYAYTRQPEMKQVQVPFLADLDVIPSCTLKEKTLLMSDDENQMANIIRLHNSDDNRLNINSSGWSTQYITKLAANASKVMRLTIARQISDGEPEVLKTLYIFTPDNDYTLIRPDDSSEGFKKGRYYYEEHGGLLGSNRTGTLAVDADGNIDLSSIAYTDSKTVKRGEWGAQDIVYSLYMINSTENDGDIAAAAELASDEVFVADIYPQFEICGYSETAIREGDDKAPSLDADYNARYVVLSIPEVFDGKTVPATVSLYEGTTLCAEYDCTGGSLVRKDSGADIASAKIDGNLLVIPMVAENSGDKFKSRNFNVVFTTALTASYENYLRARYDNATVDSWKAVSREYGCPDAGTMEFTMPSITFADPNVFRLGIDGYVDMDNHVIETGCEIVLNDASDFYDHESVLASQWFAFADETPAAKSVGSRAVVEKVITTKFNDGVTGSNIGAQYEDMTEGQNPKVSFYVKHPSAVNYSYDTDVRVYVPVKSNLLPDMEPSYLVAHDVQSHSVDVSQEVTTGIDDIVTDGEENAVYYNLQGVEVVNPQRGIYIRRTSRGSQVVKL